MFAAVAAGAFGAHALKSALTPDLLAVWHTAVQYQAWHALALLAVRPWPRLALGAFLATMAYAIGWYAEYYTDPQFGMTLAFATDRTRVG